MQPRPTISNGRSMCSPSSWEPKLVKKSASLSLFSKLSSTAFPSAAGFPWLSLAWESKRTHLPVSSWQSVKCLLQCIMDRRNSIWDIHALSLDAMPRLTGRLWMMTNFSWKSSTCSGISDIRRYTCSFCGSLSEIVKRIPVNHNQVNVHVPPKMYTPQDKIYSCWCSHCDTLSTSGCVWKDTCSLGGRFLL